MQQLSLCGFSPCFFSFLQHTAFVIAGSTYSSIPAIEAEDAEIYSCPQNMKGVKGVVQE